MKYHVKRKNARTICQERGINYGTWVYRVYTLGMDRMAAMNKPVRTKEFVAKRIEEVLRLHKKGLNRVNIANRVGLTPIRISQIIKRYANEEE